MHPRSLTRYIATALVAVSMAAASAKADEVNVLIQNAKSAYASGNYSEAIDQIDAAEQLLREKKNGLPE